MAFMFYRGLSIPLWAVAVSAVALGTMPPAIALTGIAVLGCTMPAIARWLRRSRRAVDVLPAIGQYPARHGGIVMTGGARTRLLQEAMEVRTQHAADAADAVRMDDDGGPSQLLPGGAATVGAGAASSHRLR